MSIWSRSMVVLVAVLGAGLNTSAVAASRVKCSDVGLRYVCTEVVSANKGLVQFSAGGLVPLATYLVRVSGEGDATAVMPTRTSAPSDSFEMAVADGEGSLWVTRSLHGQEGNIGFEVYPLGTVVYPAIHVQIPVGDILSADAPALAAIAVANPPRPQACGLDIVLVMDSSGSVNNTELNQTKNAFIAFVNAFLPATPTQFAVIDFDTQSIIRTGFTSNITVLTNAINVATSGGNTNWDDALFDALSLLPHRLDKPDMIVFSSDGNPNRGGGHSPHGSVNNKGANNLGFAVLHADAAKTAGVRIEAIGIGDGLSIANLEAISGPGDVTVADFNTLAQTLSQLAVELCSGTVTVTKLLDADGNLGTTGDQTPASGWTFSTAVDAPDTSTPLSGMTNGSGEIEFAIGVGADETAVTDIIETLQAGHTFLGATCLEGVTPVGTPGVNRVDNITVNSGDDIQCTFINHKIPVCGDGVVDFGEECDDGNTSNGDCCSSTCEFESNGSPCAADSNQCTQDICDGAGACVHPPHLISTPCEADGNLCTNDHCNGFGVCVFLSNVSCPGPVPPCEGGSVCNPGTGLCDPAADAPMGTSCNEDGSLCTIDECDGNGSCVNVGNVSCQPANPPCEAGEMCDAGTGACVPLIDPAAGTSCNADGNLCTEDECDGNGLCVNVGMVNCPGPTGPCDAGYACTPATGNCDALPDPVLGTACESDGDLCTLDQCNGTGSCVTYDTVTCPGSTGICDAGQQCDPGTGNCVHLPDAPSGTGCEEDGNLCTNEECNGSGDCVFVSNVSCPGPSGPCDGGTACTPGTGACDDLPDALTGTPCDRDGDQCTIDACDGSGTCVFVGNVACLLAVPPCEGGELCDPMTGVCVPQLDAPPSTPCEADGDLCTDDHCNGFGSCVLLSVRTCQAADPPCEGGQVCNSMTGLCEDVPDANLGTPCELDGDLCTVDHCNGMGQCVFLTTVTCQPALPPCEAGQLCNPGTGLCEDLTDASLGTACERDGDLCTLDHCDGTGSCVQFGDVTCQMPDPPCEAGEVCDPQTGNCVALMDAPLSTNCEADGDLCTLDHCDGSGACVTFDLVDCPGPTNSCDGGTECDPLTGTCVDLPDAALGTGCERDGDLCTIDECDGAGSCVTVDHVMCPGSTGPCDAGQQCEPATGVCVNLPDPPFATPCEVDGDLCTIEHCDGAGACVVFDAVDCPGPSGDCDGGTACTPATGACDPLPEVPADTPCERDGNLCTIDVCDGFGQCVNQGDVECDNPVPPCEAGEMCNPNTGLCEALTDPAMGTSCDLDMDLCTIDQCDGNGMCVNVGAVVCPAPNPPCEGGAECNPADGKCMSLPDAPQGTMCERDANLCTIDECDGAGNCVQVDVVVCQPAVPPCEAGEVCNIMTGVCDTLPDAGSGTPCESDGDECTDDVCDGAGACTHNNNGLCGACCLANQACVENVLAATCEGLGGSHLGEGTVCHGDSDGDGIDDQCDICPGVDDAVFAPGCLGAIPTVSEWGLVVLALLLMVGGKLYFGRREVMA